MKLIRETMTPMVIIKTIEIGNYNKSKHRKLQQTVNDNYPEQNYDKVKMDCWCEYYLKL